MMRTGVVILRGAFFLGPLVCAALVACGLNGAETAPVDASTDAQTADERSAEAPSSPDAGSPSDSPASTDSAPQDAGSPEEASTADAGSVGQGPFLVDAVDLSLGDDTACALRQDGTVVCWGSNLVTSTVTWSADAGPVVVQKVVVYFQNVCILDTQGRVWCLGYNVEGLNGNGAPSDFSIQTTPSQVVEANNQPIRAVALGGGSYNACALRADGSVVCWGADDYRQLGQAAPMVTDSGVSYSAVAMPVPGVSIPGGMLPKGFGEFTCAADTAGGITCWGINSSTSAWGRARPMLSMLTPPTRWRRRGP